MERCRALVERAEATLDALRDQGVEDLGCRSITGLVAHARRQIDQVERRLLRGETIPHEETALHMTPSEVEMEPRTDVTDSLRDVGGDAALVRELAVPIDDGATARLHQKALGEVHPDVGAGEAADHEIGAIDRRAIHVPVGALGTCRQAQDERVDADTVDGPNRGPDDAAETCSRRGQCGRIDLLGTRLRKSSRESDQHQDAALPTPKQEENHGSITSRSSHQS